MIRKKGRWNSDVCLSEIHISIIGIAVFVVVRVRQVGALFSQPIGLLITPFTSVTGCVTLKKIRKLSVQPVNNGKQVDFGSVFVIH